MITMLVRLVITVKMASVSQEKKRNALLPIVVICLENAILPMDNARPVRQNQREQAVMITINVLHMMPVTLEFAQARRWFVRQWIAVMLAAPVIHKRDNALIRPNPMAHLALAVARVALAKAAIVV